MINKEYIDRFSQLRVLVIGEAMLDCYLQGNSGRICQEAPVPVVNISSRQDLPGGAANTAANVTSLSGEAIFISVVGNDFEGDRLIQSLEKSGVSTKHLLVCPSRTTLAKNRVFAGSQLLVRFDHGSTKAIDPETEQNVIDRLIDLFPICDAVIVSDYGYGIVTRRMIQTLANLQASTPRIIVVDSKDLSAYGDVGVTAIKPNYDQAVQLLGIPKLTGCDRIEQVTTQKEKLLKLTRARIAAVTLDSDGAVLFDFDNQPYHIPVQPASNSHATGAGDTFLSALTLALAAGADSNTAASLATAATAVVVTQQGTTTCSIDELRQALSENKKLISDRSVLAKLVQQYHSSDKRIVFTNGCFDILHSGHVTYLQQAKALGDILIIGVNSDQSVKQLKGSSRPINPLSDRLSVLSALESVDYVIPFTESTPIELIKIVRPDIYVKGGDYTPQTLPEAPVVKELGGIVKILPFVSDRSTTSIINRIYQR